MTYVISDVQTVDGAKANGIDENSISFVLLNDNNYVSNEKLTLSLNGNALFSENSKSEIELTTDSLGKATASLTDNFVEQVLITITLERDTSIYKSAVVSFTKVNLKASNIFVLMQEDDAKANGTDENVVGIQAFDDEDTPVPVPSVEITVTLSNGAVFPDQTQKTTITTSADDGTAALKFTNVNPGVSKVVAFLPADMMITNSINANFSEVKPVLQTTLAVTNNNVIANGDAYDSIEATVLNRSSQKPLAGISVTFTVSNGPATFIDKAKTFTNTSDADGKVYARLVSSEKGSSQVIAETYTGASNSVYVDFTEDYSELEIVRIFNSIKSFSEEGPTTAWPNATFYVQASGGSGDFDWSSNKDTDLKFENKDEMNAVFVFTSNASPNTPYTIQVTDNITGLSTSHTFTLSVFFSSFGEWSTYNLFHKEQFPKLGELTALYEEWGDMSKYPGWLINNGYNYWSDTEELGLAQAVNLKTGSVNTLLAVITRCGYAITKK